MTRVVVLAEGGAVRVTGQLPQALDAAARAAHGAVLGVVLDGVALPPADWPRIAPEGD